MSEHKDAILEKLTKPTARALTRSVFDYLASIKG